MEQLTFTGIDRLQAILNEALLEEWEAQGHSINGAVVREIDYRVTQTVNEVILSGYMPFYGNIIARGVKPGNIPYSGRSGRGGTSKYIQALQRYAQLRMGLDEKESLGVAFAIANTQKKSGMPTPGSYRYSSTGKRTGWVEEALRRGEDKLTITVRELTNNYISINIDALLAKWQVELSKN
ncbi:hypothetical protein D4R42_02635 [bacterium]|nr:MAG: hypothetical protein D4R42_02635 [bacterium]